MHTDISFWNLFINASLVVKLVLFILVTLSVISWALIFYNFKKFNNLLRGMNSFILAFNAEPSLLNLKRKLSNSKGMLESIVVEACDEAQSIDIIDNDKLSFIIESLSNNVENKISTNLSQLSFNFSSLATIQSVSPYIGLFGTVCGIMQAFIGLSQIKHATLHVVAPGIAEALIATAIGLVAAIPAGIAYNMFSTKLEKIAVKCDAFKAKLLTKVNKQLLAHQ